MNPVLPEQQPARRRVARERARLRPPGPDEQVAARPAQGGCGKGLSGLSSSVSVQRKRACDDACRSQVDCLRPEPESRAPKGVRPAQKRWAIAYSTFHCPFG